MGSRDLKLIFLLGAMLFCLFWAVPVRAYVEYYSTNYPDMYLSMDERSRGQGVYDYYVPDGQGGSTLYDGGDYVIQGNQIIFQSYGNNNMPPATILDECTIEWGQSGRFVNRECQSQGISQEGAGSYDSDYGSGGSTSTGTASSGEELKAAAVVIDPTGGIYMLMPHVGIPMQGTISIYDITGVMVSDNPITIQLTDLQVSSPGTQVLAAMYVPEYNILYFPYIVVVDLSQPNQPVVVQNTLFTVNLDNAGNAYLVLYDIYNDMPDYATYASYYGSGDYGAGSSYGNSSGGSGSADEALLALQQDMQEHQMLFNTMSNIMDTMNDTSLSIINNIGDPGYTYEYEYDYDYNY